MKKLIWIFALLLTCSLTACGGNDAVAEVNGETVTIEEFDFYWDNLSKIYEANEETLSEDMKQTVSEQLVYDTLLEQTMAELGLSTTQEEEEAFYLAEMELAYGSYEAGLELMEEYGLDEDFFRYQYRCRLYEERIMDALAEETDVTVTKEQAQELYDAAPELYDWRQVSHLRVKPYAADGRTLVADSEGNTIYTEEEWATAKASAEEYLAELESGEDFYTLAVKYSDSADASGGGRIEEPLYRDSEDFDEAFLDAAFSLTAIGDYTKEPIRTNLGYELICLDEMLSPDDMESVLAYIIETQTEQNRRSLLTQYIAEKEQDAEIRYH
ncbi:MAG: peptidylprolyl isomerase [Firmicutes bacterium]|nr:peptidylprolyl isomerase [Bacillota bacterium]